MRNVIDEFNKKINILIENDSTLEYVVYKTLGNYNGHFHILFMYELNLKGKYLKKLYEKCCNSDFRLFLLTIKSIKLIIRGIKDNMIIKDLLIMDKKNIIINEINDNISVKK